MEIPPRILSTIELTGVEKVFSINGSWLTIGYAAHLTGDSAIVSENIHCAIGHLLKRHPRMRTRIRVDGFQRWLDMFDYDEEHLNANLFYSIQETTDQTWQQIVEDVCNRSPYSDHGQTAFPLFHFMLVQDSCVSSAGEQLFHLILFSNHSVSDGRSGFILINDLLTLVTSADLSDRVERVNTQIIPCMVSLIPRPYGRLYPLNSALAKPLFLRQLRQLQHPRIPVKTTFLPNQSKAYALQPMKAHFLFASSSTSLYAPLRERCQAEQVTVHGPLLACLLLAAHQCFPVQKKGDRYLQPCNVDLDFDMRARLPDSPLSPSTVGYCVGLSTVKLKRRLPLASSSFWELARKCVAKTRQAVQTSELSFTQHIFKDMSTNERKFNRLFTSSLDGRVSELNLSNIGKYPFSCEYHQGQLRLRGLHIVNNFSIYHTSNVLFVTCVGQEQMDFSFAHEMESEEKAEGFLRCYIQLIEKCARADANITLEQLLKMWTVLFVFLSLVIALLTSSMNRAVALFSFSVWKTKKTNSTAQEIGQFQSVSCRRIKYSRKWEPDSDSPGSIKCRPQFPAQKYPSS